LKGCSDEDGEELKEAYKFLYVKLLKLRETRQQHVQQLNGLKIERSTMLIKIVDLEVKLLEVQLQIERLTDEKLTHMLSVQKSPTNKPGLRYVAYTSDITYISKTVFVKPTVPELPLACVDKGKVVISGDVPTEPTQKRPTMRGPPICHHYGLSDHIRLKCPLLKAQRLKVKKKPPSQATSDTKPPAWHQAPQHQRRQQQFVPANHNGKPKKNKSRHYKKKPQKLESDKSYEGLPILMRSLLRWMNNQMKACQQPPWVRQVWVRKDEVIHPFKGRGLT
jgi:hypothetical protein